MNNEIELLWKIYQEQANYGRHHETQRASMTNLILIVCVAIIGAITFDKRIDLVDLALSCTLIVLGFFGVLFSKKHYERFNWHRERALQCFHKIDELSDGLDLRKLMNKAEDIQAKNFSSLHKFRMHNLWSMFHFIIILVGLLLTILSLRNV